MVRKVLLALVAAAWAGCAGAQEKPATLRLGIATFLSGPASVFGVPAKSGAELWIEQLNAAGGLQGVKLAPTFIDEGLGGDKFLSEYRRVTQESGDKVMLAAISSGDCLTVAPVAEDLKVLNIMWDCGTEKVLEEPALQACGAHAGERRDRDGRDRDLPAQDEAGLQDARGGEPGLRLGP